MGDIIGQEFWDEKHLEEDPYWLTGSTLGTIRSTHGINFEEYTNKRILEIGVGKGKVLKELSNYTNDLVGCDISRYALNKVVTIAETYLTEELQYIEPVDLAICHLVCQHCTNAEVSRIINDVKLKKNGVLSLQYAYLVDEIKDFKDIYVELNLTHFFRSSKEMLKMIDKTNKQVIKPPIIKTFPDFNWQIITVGNRNEI